MNIKVKLRLNSFSYELVGIARNEVPAYILQYEGKVMFFGKEALRSVQLYPQYVKSLSYAILDNDLNTFRKMIECFTGLMYVTYGESSFDIEVMEYMPEQFIKAISNSAGIRRCISVFRRQELKVLKGGLFNSGYQDEKGKQIISDKKMLLLQISKMAADSIPKNLEMDGTTYKRTLRRIFAVLKSTFPDVLQELVEGHGNPATKIPTQDGNVVKYLLEHQKSALVERKIDHVKSKNAEEQFLLKSMSYFSEGNGKVVFISPFSYGKSTIINSLAGFDTLKMEYRAETSAITEVTFSPVRMFTVEYQDGALEIVEYSDGEELKKLLPKYNGIDATRKDIRKITLHSPDSDMPGISLIDSPGLLSIHSKHDHIAGSMIQNADMVVFVVDPMQVGASKYMVTIEEYIRKFKIGKYCFAINKLDTFYDCQEKIRTELDLSIQQFKIPKVPVFMISGLIAYIGKSLFKGTMKMDVVRRMKNVYLYDDEGDVLSGRQLNESHIEELIRFSNIDSLDKFIFHSYQMMGVGK